MTERTEELQISAENIAHMQKAYKNAFGREGEFQYEEKLPDVVEIDGLVAIAFGLLKQDSPPWSKKRPCEVKRWFVEAIKWSPATRHEPADVDYAPVSDHDKLQDAIIAAFGVIVQTGVDNYFENLYWEQQAKDWEEDQKAGKLA
jgi:hypothetical protein